ncbi:MAG TPA: hypothetical protein DD716_05395 [Thiomicrospira sp.]|jgi:pterin-4a-carbinolamine dehydratase|nr:hypothetical protein [Thiomicrospira sp.]
MSSSWKSKKKPLSLDRRFDFDGFEVLREFLDEVAEHADQLNHHPNISFGRKHASVIIYSESKSQELNEVDLNLAKLIDSSYNRLCNISEGDAL